MFGNVCRIIQLICFLYMYDSLYLFMFYVIFLLVSCYCHGCSMISSHTKVMVHFQNTRDFVSCHCIDIGICGMSATETILHPKFIKVNHYILFTDNYFNSKANKNSATFFFDSRIAFLFFKHLKRVNFPESFDLTQVGRYK